MSILALLDRPSSAASFSDQFAALAAHDRFAGSTWQEMDDVYGTRGILVTCPNVPISHGWNRTHITFSFWVSAAFPIQRPAHFFTARDIVLRTDTGERNPQWTRWTDWPMSCMRWFWTPTHWSGNSDTLLTYANVVRMRFAETK
jgi:hypothetical protein